MYGIFTYIWLFLMVKYGKCRQIYHTWMLWDRLQIKQISHLHRIRLGKTMYSNNLYIHYPMHSPDNLYKRCKSKKTYCIPTMPLNLPTFSYINLFSSKKQWPPTINPHKIPLVTIVSSFQGELHTFLQDFHCLNPLRGFCTSSDGRIEGDKILGFFPDLVGKYGNPWVS